MTVSLDLDVQIQLVLAAAGELNDFIQCGDRGSLKVRREKRSVIQILDLIVGHFPDILVKTGGSFQIVIVHDNDRPVFQHLHVQLSCREVLVDALLESRHRILRRLCGKAAVCHDHGESVLCVH